MLGTSRHWALFEQSGLVVGAGHVHDFSDGCVHV